MTACQNALLHEVSSLPALDGRLLYPLGELLDTSALAVSEREAPGGPPLPEPQRGLLVHDRDMTSTLAAFHGEPIGLDVLTRRREGTSLYRQVLLRGTASQRIVEYGAIRIELSAFPTDARFAVLEGRTPLGAILAQYRIRYTSRPRLFFAVEADASLGRLLGLEERAGDSGLLYGRRNVLADPSGSTLAEVVEILPPIA